MKSIVIDDEPIARAGMKRLIESRPELQLAAMMDSAGKASEWLDENEAALIFLDIEMPGVNGIEFARGLSPRHIVIFTTAYTEYAVDGYDVQALDYLVKPIDPDRFNTAVDRALAHKKLLDNATGGDDGSDTGFLTVKSERRYVRMRISDILFVEGLKDYVIIHLPDKRIVTRATMMAMEKKLTPPAFLRVSKSYIVNCDKIDSFDNNDVYIGTKEIAIGASYRETAVNRLLG